MTDTGSATERPTEPYLRLLERFSSVTSQPIVSWSSDGTGEALFREGGELCFSVSFWTGVHGLEGFLVHDEETDIELLVRDLGKLRSEPFLCELAQRLCAETGVAAPEEFLADPNAR